MDRRLVPLISIVILLLVVLAGCGPDPNEQYATSVSKIVDEWRVIINDWNAAPGDANVATDFALLQGRAKAIDPPTEIANLHSLLLTSMEAEAKSFEVYAVGNKEESAALHVIALDGMEKYTQALRNLDLIE